VSVEQLAAFARWLERSPSRKHRPGASRRRAVAPNVVPLAPARSPATVDGILTVAVEFLRFRRLAGLGRAGWRRGVEHPGRAALSPAAFRPRGAPRPAGGEPGAGFAAGGLERPPATLTCDQVGALVDACANARDRFVVEALYATGLRAAELCGLHLSDLHLLPSAVASGLPGGWGTPARGAPGGQREWRVGQVGLPAGGAGLPAAGVVPRRLPVGARQPGRGGRQRLPAGQPLAAAAGPGASAGSRR